MSRTDYWFFIASLNVVAVIAFHVRSYFPFDGKGHWLVLSDFIKSHDSLNQAMTFLTKAWPTGLSVTSNPFGQIDFNFVFIPIYMPLLLISFFLTLGPTAQRARDSGYSPWGTLVLLHLSVIGVVILYALLYAFAAILGIGAIPISIIVAGYLGYVAPVISLIAALLAIYILTSPTNPAPPPSEVTP